MIDFIVTVLIKIHILSWFRVESSARNGIAGNGYPSTRGATRRENQCTFCNFSIWTVSDVAYTRKLCCDRKTARCRCKIRYLSKFTPASRGSPCDSTALVLNVVHSVSVNNFENLIVHKLL